MFTKEQLIVPYKAENEKLRPFGGLQHCSRIPHNSSVSE